MGLERFTLEQLRRFDQGGPVWEEYRRTCSNLYFFGKWVFTQRPAERNLWTYPCHGPMALLLEHINKGRVNRVLLEDQRRGGKSTWGIKNRLPHKLILRILAGEDPADLFAIMGFTKGNAKRQWRDIKWEFETNKFFQFLFPELIPDFQMDLWNFDEGIIPKKYRMKDPTFDTLGVGSSSASRHYGDLTEDDMITEENYRSEAAVNAVIEYHQLAENLLEEESDPVLVIGNRWTLHDLNNWIYHNQPEYVIFSRSGDRGPRLDERLDEYQGKFSCRNLPENVMELLRQMPDGEPIWPERFDREALGRLMQKLGPKVYSAHVQNNPTDPANQVLDLAWLRKVTLEQKTVGVRTVPYLMFEGDEEPVLLDDCTLYIGWDPGMKKKHSRSKNAIVVAVMDYKSRIGIIREWAKIEAPLVALDVFLSLCWRYRYWLKGSAVEEVLFSSVLGDRLEERQAEWKKAGRNIDLRLRRDIKLPKGEQKDNRIFNWLGTHAQNQNVYVRPGCTGFIEEYGHFGIEGAGRDILDAAALLTRIMKPSKAPDARLILEDAAYERLAASNFGICGYGSTLA